MKTALVTGAASGIGQATAVRFAQAGYAVYGGDMDTRGLDETLSLAKGASGKFVPCGLDVRDESQMAAFATKAASEEGGVHAAVNCAGIARTGLVHDLTLDSWNFTISVNLTGTFLLAKHAIPHLQAAGGGAFVAVSSDAGVRGASGYAAYCASKHGVIGLVRCLALDYGRDGIRSNAVCPGFVQTKMMDQLFAEASDPEAEKASYMREVPNGRFARPDEVANVILHLASDEASYTNGICYSIDGGVTAGHFE
ncbi:SDR family NAD(P)-dependent oxidoreductase [Burkholderia ubonensis]|uniref:SDR family NAD(P)-dependent oxidoreductase n=1 Tax=Burkholderia ubonensis TaxID=101571 RepID=UPI0007C6418D|nr:SDR family oxidoreductase [Burkholderia ubonensis]